MKTRLVLALSAIPVILGLAAASFIPSLQAASGRRIDRTDSSAGNKSRVGYAIVVPANHPELDGAVQALKTKHAALAPKVFSYKQDVREVLPDLREMLPYYTCFVTPKELAGRAFTGEVSRMAREILPDPYCDTFWGILTGYNAADIKRVAEFKGPIDITDALDMVGGFHHSLMRRCYSFDETQENNLRITDPARKYDNEHTRIDRDFTEDFLKLVNGGGFQIIMTSGHASEHDWASGYVSSRNMYLIDRNGKLAARDTRGRVTELRDTTPKIWCAAGNCLIGNIPHGQDSCMATAMIHSFGVYQFMGYTIETWFGRQGWTAQGMLTDYPGYYSFTESFHFANAWIVENLVKRDLNHITLDTSDYDTFQIKAASSLRGIRFRNSEDQKEALGLLYDRDVVAFYGDPAMRAAIDPKPGQTLKLERSLDGNGGVLTLKLTALKEDQWKEQGVYLPYGFVMASPEIVSKSFDADVIAASAFACVKLKGKIQKGDTITLSIKDAGKNGRKASGSVDTIRKALSALPAGATSTTLESRLNRALSRIPQDKIDTLAVLAMTPPEGPYLAALLAEMPECDYGEVNPIRLLEDVRYALKARSEIPWKDQISEDLFLRYILPYWSVNEKRDPWRKFFYDKFMPAVRGLKTPSDAVKYLNDHVFKELNVTYDAVKRPKADQSAQESIAASYASCTGLSVILLNACRACGIPARFTGCPQWTDRSGNHSWIEFWDGQWIYEGASSSDPRNRSWVGDKVKEATEDSLVGGVWAVTTEPQQDGAFFVLPWKPSDRSYPAVPLRAFYLDDGMVSYDISRFSGEKSPVWLYYKGEPWYRLAPPVARTIDLPASVLADMSVRLDSNKEAGLVPLVQAN
ncbi:MAG: transglutaminase domain-containing protein [Lentisphaeria bacterium]|nr:transglutaminase domain-containing protein [Lentisphaeria bacterium]